MWGHSPSFNVTWGKSDMCICTFNQPFESQRRPLIRERTYEEKHDGLPNKWFPVSEGHCSPRQVPFFRQACCRLWNGLFSAEQRAGVPMRPQPRAAQQRTVYNSWVIVLKFEGFGRLWNQLLTMLFSLQHQRQLSRSLLSSQKKTFCTEIVCLVNQGAPIFIFQRAKFWLCASYSWDFMFSS